VVLVADGNGRAGGRKGCTAVLSTRAFLESMNRLSLTTTDELRTSSPRDELGRMTEQAK
jgi:hypothetical protein